MNIEKFTVGLLEENCYICYDESLEGIIIDPGADAPKLIEFIKNNNITIKYIVNTHGHADHISANNPIKDLNANTKILIHKNDVPFLTDPTKNLSFFIEQSTTSYEADILLDEKSHLSFGNNNQISIIETPGHTPGSICVLINNKYLFSGDTIFFCSIGRTDLPMSMPDKMESSLAKLKLLDPSISVFAGHGRDTTIGYEIDNNQFLNF